MKKINLRTFINILLVVFILFLLRGTLTSCFFNETLVEVPNVLNMDKNEALKVLKKANLNGNILSSRSNNVPINYVYEQKPEAGSFVKKNRAIKLLINDDTGEKIPNLKGLTLVQAMSELQKANIQIERVDYMQTEGQDNRVLATYPDENQRREYNQKISLLVSTQSLLKSDRMPNIVGLDVNEANALLAQIGLKISEISKISNTTYPLNTIVKVTPEPETKIDANTVIKVVISEANQKEIKEEKIKQESIDDLIKKALEEQGGKQN